MFRDQPDLRMTATDVEPMAGIRTVRQIEHSARALTREYARQAREDGHAWGEIGAALGLSASAEHRGVPSRMPLTTTLPVTPMVNMPAATAAVSPGHAPPAGL